MSMESRKKRMNVPGVGKRRGLGCMAAEVRGSSEINGQRERDAPQTLVNIRT